MSVPGEIAAAYRAGAASWDTAAPGEQVPNPYDGRSDTARERVLAMAWTRGRHSRIDPVFREQQ